MSKLVTVEQLKSVATAQKSYVDNKVAGVSAPEVASDAEISEITELFAVAEAGA